MSLNLTALAEKYDAAAVEDDLANLDDEIADEVAVEATLNKDSAAKTAEVLEFIESSKILITDQHARMIAGVASLKEKVARNMDLEAADAEYAAAVGSEEALDVARMLAEMNALSAEYQDLLLASGRVGRPPL